MHTIIMIIAGVAVVVFAAVIILSCWLCWTASSKRQANRERKFTPMSFSEVEVGDVVYLQLDGVNLYRRGRVISKSAGLVFMSTFSKDVLPSTLLPSYPVPEDSFNRAGYFLFKRLP